MAEEKKDLSLQLRVLEKEGANLLMPSTDIAGLSEFHAPVIEKVALSTNPDDGDVYPHDNAKEGSGKKYRLTKQALMKLSVCAGVIWSPTESKRIDNGADRNYIAYRAVGGIRKADGQPIFFSAEYDIDFEVLEEELKEQYTKKAEAKDSQGNYYRKTPEDRAAYIEYCVKRDMLDKRKFKLRLCESGAMNRVLRMLLGIKQAYTTEELKKPFVMARIVFRPDFTDQSVRQQFIDASIKAMTGIYGQGAAATVPEKMEPINITPLPSEKEEDVNGKGDPKPEPDGQGPVATQGTPKEILLTDFQSMNQGERIKAITLMSEKREYNLTAYISQTGKKSFGELKPETLVKFYAHLLSLPEKKQEDDIPF